jgi:hypothetical protein
MGGAIFSRAAWAKFKHSKGRTGIPAKESKMTRLDITRSTRAASVPMTIMGGGGVKVL